MIPGCKMYRIAIFFFLVGLVPRAFSQQVKSGEAAVKNYHTAMELFQKEKYTLARVYFEKALKDVEQLSHEQENTAAFHQALSAKRLFNKDTEYLLHGFIHSYPASKWINLAFFEMGLYQYYKKDYDDAIHWFGQVDENQLIKKELAEFHFKRGYSHFMEGNLEEAKYALFDIKDGDSKYAGPALYYYSHIAYEEESYETALRGFRKLEDDETFAPIVPYYISQLLYLQKKYYQVIDYAPAILPGVTEKREAEVARIIGESYYHLEMYHDAIEYLSLYREKTRYLNNSDSYQLGYAYYKTGDYQQAVDLFEKVVNTESELGQNAMYHLGDAYIQLGLKNKARMAFYSASRLDYDKKIEEDALFNYAALTLELSYSPFNEAIRAIEDYIDKYPGSERIEKAYNLLVMGYMHTRNYQGALNSIERIKNKSPEILKAYQRVAFFRGLELYNSHEFSRAVEMFDLSLQYPRDKSLHSRALFWKAQAYSRLGQEDIAAGYYQEYLQQAGRNYLSEEYKLAHYGLGYAYFNQEKYQESKKWFLKFIDMADKGSKTVADANNRLGDIYFVASGYSTAREYYKKAHESRLASPDYALFQIAFTNGLMGHHQEKISRLNQLMKEFPNSNYLDDALFEIGKSLISLQSEQKAAEYFKRLVKEYPGSSYAIKSLIQLGLVYYNLGDNEQAISYYKQVVEGFPGTPEAKRALTGIKNIHVEMSDVEGYLAYVNTLGEYADVKPSTRDSLMYKAAENIYMQNNCEKAIEKFKNYLNQFPSGNFMVNANFYLGDCLFQQGKYDEALKPLKSVIDAPRNPFTEQALISASVINMENENYDAAAGEFEKLIKYAEIPENVFKAKIGLTRAYYKSGNYEKAIDAAQNLIETENLPVSLSREARFIIAKSALAKENLNLALENFARVASEVKSKEGAESKFRIAEIYYMKGNLDMAEKEIFDFIDNNSPQQYWLARAFILLADVYVDKEDEFQAIHTLQSIIDYYTGKDDEILETARQKKQQLLEKERLKGQMNESEDMEIRVEGDASQN